LSTFLLRRITTSTIQNRVLLLKTKFQVHLSLEEQMGKLAQRREHCEAKIMEPPPGPGLYCNATWDNAMCWEYTEAGTIVEQPCPDYINAFNIYGFATRECLSDGTWRLNPKYNKTTSGWTNYSGCAGPTPSPPVDYSHHFTKIQLMSEVGYGLSLVALIIAVLIMIASKRLHYKSNILHINLFCAFILRASVTFIKTLLFVDDIGLEKDIVRKKGAIEFATEGTLNFIFFLNIVRVLCVRAKIGRHGFLLAILFCFLNEEVNICIRAWVIGRLPLPQSIADGFRPRSTMKYAASGIDGASMDLIREQSCCRPGEKGRAGTHVKPSRETHV
ncbi:GLP2R-like protein, partial [Mya arenaria]